MYRNIEIGGVNYHADLGILVDHRITIMDEEILVSADIDGRTPGASFEATFTGRGKTSVLVAPEEYVIGPATMEPGDDLKIAQAAKLAEISAAYAEFDAIGTAETSAGYPVQVGQAHVTKLDGAIRFAEMTDAETIYITDAGNVTHYNVSIADARGILLEQMGAALAAHAKKQTLRAQVEAAETVEEIDAIAWTATVSV
jgi:hypothetical protein